jgi:hypothetical protein
MNEKPEVKTMYWRNLFFFDFGHRLDFNEARRFGKPLCFHLQASKAPTWWTP